MTFVQFQGATGAHVEESIDEVMSERERAEAYSTAKWGQHGTNDRWMRLTPRSASGRRMYVFDPAKFVYCDGELR